MRDEKETALETLKNPCEENAEWNQMETLPPKVEETKPKESQQNKEKSANKEIQENVEMKENQDNKENHETAVMENLPKEKGKTNFFAFLLFFFLVSLPRIGIYLNGVKGVIY